MKLVLRLDESKVSYKPTLASSSSTWATVVHNVGLRAYITKNCGFHLKNIDSDDAQCYKLIPKYATL